MLLFYEHVFLFYLYTHMYHFCCLLLSPSSVVSYYINITVSSYVYLVCSGQVLPVISSMVYLHPIVTICSSHNAHWV